jgi:hypothetical protein
VGNSAAIPLVESELHPVALLRRWARSNFSPESRIFLGQDVVLNTTRSPHASWSPWQFT